MNKPLFCAAFLLLSSVTAGLSQEQTAPTMNPESTPKPKSGSPLGVLQKDRPKGAKTEITCTTEATFSDNSSIATFVGQVVVKDPQFNLFCKKLTIYLNKERKGIERAEAEGDVVIVQENVNEKGEKSKSIGRGGKAIVTPDTGDIELRESPSITQGINHHVATEPTTIMILNREGTLNTNGGSKTLIIDATEAGGL